MKKMALLLSLLPLLSIERCFADGEPVGNVQTREEEPPSAASFDERLPPVIPGEEIPDGDRKIKVWSTSGSVSANPPPVPPAPNQPPLSVVIDRDDHRHRGNGHYDGHKHR